MTTIYEGNVEFRGEAFNVTKCVLFDDFIGDVIDAYWGVNKGSDAQTVNFAHQAALNGVIRGTTGDDAGATMAINGIQLHAALQWQANQGGLVMECRLKTSGITDFAMFVGFTDQIAALEEPFSLSGTTYTSNATDAVGFLFDSAATTDTIRCVGVANDVDVTHVDSSRAYVNDTYKKLRVTISSTGSATFQIDGADITSIAACVTATVPLTPVITAASRGAASRNVDVDYVYIAQNR